MKTPISISCIVWYFVASTSLQAAQDPSAAGSRQAAMSSSGVTFSDFWSVTNNQAGLGFNKNLSVGFFLENRYLLPPLSLKVAGMALPLRGGTLGLSISHFGDKTYSESSGGIAFGKAFGNKFAAGFRVNYCLTRVADGYGNTPAITFEGGIISVLSEKFSLGAHVYNPAKIRISKQEGEMIPIVFKIGCLLKISDHLNTVADIVKSSSQKPELRTGFEYQAAKPFFIRGGISTQTTVFSFGAGLYWQCLKVDFSSTWHQYLGYSPQISVIYEFCK